MSAEQQQAHCLAQFREAVREGRRGQHSKAKALVERVRTAHGDFAAQVARKELHNFIKSDKGANEAIESYSNKGSAEIAEPLRVVKRNGKTIRV